VRQDDLTLEERLAIIRSTAEPIKELAQVSKVAEFLYKNAFTFTLNANDTFGWACADAVDVAITDLPKLLEMDEKFGNDGICAFMALIREEDVMPEAQGDNYKAAVAYLKDYLPCTWVG